LRPRTYPGAVAEIPRAWLRKSRRGLWYCVRDIPPARIAGVVDFDALSQSPVMA
jgi:hypothetical protein